MFYTNIVSCQPGLCSWRSQLLINRLASKIYKRKKLSVMHQKLAIVKPVRLIKQCRSFVVVT